MDTADQSGFWALVDGVSVINLDQRTDRWAQFQSAARGIVPPEKLHRLSARLGREIPGFGQRPWFRGRARDATWAARAGVLQSHRRALLRAREAGWRTTLVLEDDVIFAPAFAALADALAGALRAQQWEVCYLGFTDPWPPCRQLAALPAGHALHRVHGCNTAHAYLVREAARDWIVSRLPDEPSVWPWLARHRAIDRWYQRRLGLQFPVACVSPSVVNQSAGFSDIVGRETPGGADDGQVRDVAALDGVVGCCAPFARRTAIQFGDAGDAVRGMMKRWTGF